jgi:hypothetical protein
MTSDYNLANFAADGVLPEVAQRVHEEVGQATRSASPDVLWTRKSADQSPLAEHIAAVRKALYGDDTTGAVAKGYAPKWNYSPTQALQQLRAEAGTHGSFEAWSRSCVEMTDNACDLLSDIIRARSLDAGTRPGRADGRDRVHPTDLPAVRSVPVIVEDDLVGNFVAQARAGANAGRTTKSNMSSCAVRAWADVMDEFGFSGVAAYPVFSLGSWWISLLIKDFPDWRQDYLAILSYSFYLEYNVDTAALGRPDPARFVREVTSVWDMPNLSEDLQIRRSHMACSMAFFDTKRKHEAALMSRPTDGLTAWVHSDRDRWRDFKALDSGGYPHYLSFAKGTPGRDDMMLAGLVNDWVDLGPDLRNEECNQSVLTLTQGSLAMSDLLGCYQRTVWMLNAQFHCDERYAGCMATIGACVWGLCNHRQDVWRYFALAFELCAEMKSVDLYRACELADCYTPELLPANPIGTQLAPPARRQMPYNVLIDGRRYSGKIALHRSICDAVQLGLLPRSVVEYQFVIPKLLGQRLVSPEAFLDHMDRTYCDHFAAVLRSGYACDFDYMYCRAVAALVMEQWWSGMYFAIGVGSLIEAQTGLVAGDRAH